MSKKILLHNEVILKYLETKSIQNTTKFFKSYYKKISKILKENNVTIYGNKKYNYDEKFFCDLNSVNSYWLGFICADGHIVRKSSSYYLEIDLAIKDINHLEKFKKDIKTDFNIIKRKCENSKRNIKWKDSYNCKLFVYSKTIVNDLSKYDLKSDKIFEDILNSQYLIDFLRGYFDGDGGVSINKNSNQPIIKIRGDEQFLKTFNEIICKNCDIPTNRKISFESGIYALQYNGKNICSKILKWLYSDAERYLDRKYELAQTLILNENT